MGTTREGSAPAWRAEGCPFANMTHAAVLPALYLPSTGAPIVRTPEVADTPSAELAALSTFLAGLPGSRAPPSVAWHSFRAGCRCLVASSRQAPMRMS